MKKSIVVFASLLIAGSSFSQDTLTTYYDIAGKETTANLASFTRKKFKTTDGWGVQDFYKSGKIKMKGTYLEDSCKTRNGEFTWYEESGIPQTSANYDRGEMDGLFIAYYSNGHKQVEGYYKKEKKNGDWIGYYESGAVSAKAHFDNNEQGSAELFNEDGKTNSNINVFNKDANFPGGDAGLKQFLVSELRYPNKAVNNNIEGRVMVHFIVEKDGRVTNAEIDRSVDDLLDKEALRVVKKMPKWEPAIMGGLLSRQYYKLPVVFSLKAK